MKRFISIILLSITISILCVPTSLAKEDRSSDLRSNNVIVLVPGFLGSELYNSSNAKVWVGAGAIVGHINCSETGSPIYSLYAYNNDNYGTLDFYENLYDSLNNTFSGSADIIFFPYDWRKTNTVASLALKNLVSGYSGKIILVTHSMGGLVASDYLRIASSNMRSRTTLISLGTPYAGAPKALQVLEDGQMFPGINFPSSIANYIINMSKNMPASYQLLPTSRSDVYMQVNGTDQTNTNAWNIIKGRDWARFSNGSGIKPMVNTAKTFHDNLFPTGSTPYALTSNASFFINTVGYSTISKVKYTLSGGNYTFNSCVYTNAGDGTVTASSARNKLSASDTTHVISVTNGGSHIGMLSNSVVIGQVSNCISKAFAGYSNNGSYLSSIPDNMYHEDSVESEFYENEKGWIIGDGIDGKRISIIIRGCSLPDIYTSGKPLTLSSDHVYDESSKSDDGYFGDFIAVFNGYQFEMLDNEYEFIVTTNDSDDSNAISAEISYMENGYYKSMITYDFSAEQNEYVLSVRASDSGDVSLRVDDGAIIPPSEVADKNTLQKLNAQ